MGLTGSTFGLTGSALGLTGSTFGLTGSALFAFVLCGSAPLALALSGVVVVFDAGPAAGPEGLGGDVVVPVVPGA